MTASGGVLSVWEAATGKPLRFLPADDASSQQSKAVFSLDNRRLAWAGDKSQIFVYDTNTWHNLLTLRGHDGRIHGLSFNRGGRLLASCAADNSVRIWDVGE
jgi:WD40 repeat protein